MVGYLRLPSVVRFLLCVVSAFLVATAVSVTSLAAAPAQVLREGDTGPAVVTLQEGLQKAGLMSCAPTGYFGSVTRQAVVAFQKQQGLVTDGVYGNGTRLALEGPPAPEYLTYTVKSGDSLWTIARKFDTLVSKLCSLNGVREDATLDVGDTLKVPNGEGPSQTSRSLTASSAHAMPMPWQQVDGIYTSQCTITDIKTGLTFSAVRRGGSLHADTEPRSAEDTATLKLIYGGAWSWDRRAVVVRVGGVAIAASINGMPHGGDNIGANDFPGHFCVHFLGSRIHATGLVDPQHQAMVRAAARY